MKVCDSKLTRGGQFKDDDISCHQECLALDTIEHVLCTTDHEDLLAGDEVNLENHGVEAVISEESLNMQNSQSVEEPNIMQYVSLEDLSLPAETSHVDEEDKNLDSITTRSQRARESHIDERSQPTLEETSQHDWFESTDGSPCYQMNSDYDEEQPESGDVQHDASTSDTNSYVMSPSNAQVDYNNQLLFHSVTPEIKHYRGLSSAHMPIHVDINQIQCPSTSITDLPLFTEDPPIIDLDQNVHLKVLSDESYIQF